MRHPMRLELINGTLTDTTTPNQSGLGSTENEVVLHTSLISSIGASPTVRINQSINLFNSITLLIPVLHIANFQSENIMITYVKVMLVFGNCYLVYFIYLFQCSCFVGITNFFFKKYDHSKQYRQNFARIKYPFLRNIFSQCVAYLPSYHAQFHLMNDPTPDSFKTRLFVCRFWLVV